MLAEGVEADRTSYSSRSPRPRLAPLAPLAPLPLTAPGRARDMMSLCPMRSSGRGPPGTPGAAADSLRPRPTACARMRAGASAALGLWGSAGALFARLGLENGRTEPTRPGPGRTGLYPMVSLAFAAPRC